MLRALAALLVTAGLNPAARPAEPPPKDAAKPIFDGKTFAGWEGDTEKTWRIEDGCVVGGSVETVVPRNEFLCTHP